MFDISLACLSFFPAPPGTQPCPIILATKSISQCTYHQLLYSIMGLKMNLSLKSWRGSIYKGVEIFVQGTVVQVTFCPGDNSLRTLLSRETVAQGYICLRMTLVHGDFCPRKLLSKETNTCILVQGRFTFRGHELWSFVRNKHKICA